MRRTAVVLSYAILCCSSLVLGQTRALSRALPADLAAGKQIFDAQCAWCHGSEGSGGSGPNLQRAALRHVSNDASLVTIVRKGIPGTEMPNFEVSITDRMAWQTAAYVRSLGRVAASATTGDPGRGAAVYEKSGCGGCHTIRGDGGVEGPELTAIGSLRGPAYLLQSIVEPAAAHPPSYVVVHARTADGKEIRGNRVNEDVFWILIRDGSGTVHSIRKDEGTHIEREPEASLMPSYSTRLSPGELEDLVAYLSTLRGER